MFPPCAVPLSNSILTAFALLTILPLRRELEYSARALAYFPIVGAALGGTLVVAALALERLFPPIVTSALLVALWALLTGALHLDGVSDACDALLAATTRERRLEILHDVHMGAFGATGLFLVLLLKFAALVSLLGSRASLAGVQAPFVEIQPALVSLLLAPVLARWAMVYAATFPLARREGMAALFAAGSTRREITVALLLTFLFVVGFGWLAAIAWLVTVVVATLLARLALARVGGLTGDIYGLICESVEVTVLLAGAGLAR
jgi:adenosylcobinamide-GDP ribazoletransferase